MRKVLLLIFLIFLALPSYADYLPVYVNSGVYYGNGLISIGDKALIYKEPDVNSQVLAVINKEKVKVGSLSVQKESETFIASVKDINLYLLPVEKDSDEWFYVCFNKKKRLFGWVKKSESIDYMSYQDFFNLYGRKNGLYFFRNLNDKYKKLYASPNLDSNVVDNFYYADHVSLWLVAKNWMLVKVITYDGKTKTGWIRWRLDDDEIIIFPKLR